MNSRIEKIRESERLSHTKIYTTEKLYESDGWLKKPIKTIEDSIRFFKAYEEIRILDLGCGVGRNAIFLAKCFEDKSCTVDCVDILPLAIDILKKNAEKHKIYLKIKGIVSSIEDFEIIKNHYDLILAVSSLEHIDNYEHFCKKLSDIKVGLKDNGLICLVINTNICEFDKYSNQAIEPNFEINLKTEALIRLLKEIFNDFQTIKLSKSCQKYDIPRDNSISELTSDVVTFVTRKTNRNSERIER